MPSSYPTEVLSTRKRGNRARGVPSPIVLMLSPLPHPWVGLTPDCHSSDPVASLTSKSICCSHHQRCGTAPLFLSLSLHSIKIGRVATYTVIVCRRIVMYSSSVLISHSSNTSFDFGYIYLFPGPLRGLCLTAIRYAARMWSPSRLAKAAVERTHVLLL
jgi:hypothetical protein